MMNLTPKQACNWVSTPRAYSTTIRVSEQVMSDVLKYCKDQWKQKPPQLLKFNQVYYIVQDSQDYGVSCYSSEKACSESGAQAMIAIVTKAPNAVKSWLNQYGMKCQHATQINVDKLKTELMDWAGKYESKLL